MLNEIEIIEAIKLHILRYIAKHNITPPIEKKGVFFDTLQDEIYREFNNKFWYGLVIFFDNVKLSSLFPN